MKKFQFKSVAVAASFACAGAVMAGSWTTPSTDALAPKHAAEALSASTGLTTASAVYTMGVQRASANGSGDMIAVITPVNGTFTTATSTPANSCSTWAPSVAGSGAATVGVLRTSATECAYTIAVTTPLQPTLTQLVFGPISYATHTLGTSGSSVGVSLNLYNASESSRVDNGAAVARTVATSATAMGMTAAADTDTIADVSFTSTATGAVPLGGFVITAGTISDSITAARAQFTITNNVLATPLLTADAPAAASYNYRTAGGAINVTVAGNFTGLSGVTVTTPSGGAVASAPVVTINAAKTQASFALAANDIGAANTSTTFNLVATTAGTASLGTQRVFGISAVANPNPGTAVTLSGNSTWWTWSANAVQLTSPFFNTDNGTGVLTRFFFQNTSAAPVTYTSVCSGETGNTVTNTASGGTGSTHTGSLVAGTTMILARDLCSFSGFQRGSIVFTINTNSANIRGLYNLGANGGGNSFIPLNRPYAGNSD